MLWHLTWYPRKDLGGVINPCCGPSIHGLPGTWIQTPPQRAGLGFPPHYSLAPFPFMGLTLHTTTIAFLTTRVKQPDEDDWGKRKWVLKYLDGMQSLLLLLSADSISNIMWYVDTSHQTHHDCQDNTGSILTFVAGVTMSLFTKHKLPSKSFTESELICVHDKMSDIQWWRRNFLEAQGYTISNNIVYQDNMSTLSLAKNGYVSSSKCTKYIKAKYVFVWHYHNAWELDLQYCTTEEMWADVLTKPLQGHKFCLMWAFLMNCPLDYSEDTTLFPSANPSLTPTCNVMPKSSTPNMPTSFPSSMPPRINKTSVSNPTLSLFHQTFLMMPWLSSTMPSLWGVLDYHPWFPLLLLKIRLQYQLLC